MVAFPYCLNSLALLASIAAGARIRKGRGRKTDTKFIAGVPVLNYHVAYEERSLGQLHAEQEWVVMVKPGVTEAQINELCHAAPNGCRLRGNPDNGGVPFFEMRGKESDLEVVAKRGGRLLKFFEPDATAAIPELRAGDNEPELWGLERIHAYSRPSEGAGVTVFILDTGIRTTHQDFGGRGIPTVDMSSGSVVECEGALSCAGDAAGHGTHCAGTAVGTTYGVAPAATVRSIKVLSDQGSGPWSWSYGALDWVATSSMRPAVASMSLGGSGTMQAMADAVEATVNAGVIVVVAAGNFNAHACNYSPAFVPSAITVGSTDSLNSRSSFSNYGPCTNIWAPGSSILSAGISSDTAFATFSGTSMACPHVAGGAALVLERSPSFNHAQVLEKLQAAARTDAITGLYGSDINKELFVGSDAPPPPGGVPAGPPAPPRPTCPAAFSNGPDGQICFCNPGLYCYYKGEYGACPFVYGTSAGWFEWTCTECICK